MNPGRFPFLIGMLGCGLLCTSLPAQTTSAGGSVTGGGATLTGSSTSNPSILPPEARDTDSDGLTDAEEVARGADPIKPDTDGDDVSDALDGWPLTHWLHPAPLPEVRYALVRLVAMGYPSGFPVNELDDQGDVLGWQYSSNHSIDDMRFFKVGTMQTYTVPLSSGYRQPPENPPNVLQGPWLFNQTVKHLGKDGRVLGGVFTVGSPLSGSFGQAATWTADAGVQVLARLPDRFVLPVAAPVVASEALAINASGQVLAWQYGQQAFDYYSDPDNDIYLADPSDEQGYWGGVSSPAGGAGAWIKDSPAVYELMAQGSPYVAKKTYMPFALNDAGVIGAREVTLPDGYYQPTAHRTVIIENGTVNDLGAGTDDPDGVDAYCHVMRITSGAPAVAVGFEAGPLYATSTRIVSMWWAHETDVHTWVKEPLRVWDGLSGKATLVSDFYRAPAFSLNDQLEMVSGSKIIRNGVIRPLSDYLPDNWSNIYTKDINNHGVILAEATRTLDDQGQPIANPQSEPVLLVPIDISFEPLGDAEPITDNKDPVSHQWMPGKGKRIFPDAKTPTETTPRNLVQVKVETGLPNHDVYLQLFDVDDPSTDTIIDPNDTQAVGKGNDNRAPAQVVGGAVVSPAPPYFYASNAATFTCKTDAAGVARLPNGTLPVFVVGMQPGDNLRVAVSLESTGLTGLQVDDKTAVRYVSADDTQVREFNGVVSPMLTVWRKLNIEVDSMEAIPTSGSEKNFETGSVQAITNNPLSNQSTVTLDILLSGPADRYEQGTLTVAGIAYQVVSNTDNLTNLTNSDQVTVKGNAPTSVAGQSFTIVDDDDNYLAQLGLPVPLPANQRHANIINGIRSKYTPAYIQLEDASASGWNPHQTIPFTLNAAADDGAGNIYDDAKDLTDRDAFWAYTVTISYQPQTSSDHDPKTESYFLGGGPKFLIGHASYGFAAIFIETIREDPQSIGDLSLNPSILNIPSQQELLRANYNNLFLGVVAHEIGHAPGMQSGNQNHAEGGLMQADVGLINAPDSEFRPATLNRFRNAERWTH